MPHATPYQIDQLQSSLVAAFNAAARAAFSELTENPFQSSNLQAPPKAEMGDYAMGCFELAKKLKQPPPMIAQRLLSTLKTELATFQAAGPYINLKMNRTDLLSKILGQVKDLGKNYGEQSMGTGKTIVLDYSSPNIAKPLAFHHLRSAVIGNALKNIFKTLGYTVIGINHLGDWGTQFGKLLTAYKHWGPQDGNLGDDPVATLNTLYVRFQKEAKDNAALNDEGRAWFKKLEQGDADAKKLWQSFRDLSLKTFEKIYHRLHITFDEVTGESFFINQVDGLLADLKAKSLSSMSEGALIVDLTTFNMPPCLLKKGDETTLYATRDLCAAIHRHKQYDFERLLYVVDTGQSLHFKQFFKVLELMGFDWAKKLEHVNFGIIKFGGTKTRTREGNVILLEEVLDEARDIVKEKIRDKNPDLANADQVAEEVGIGAVVFADLSGRRERDVNFVWEEILNFDGRTGPYLQYSYARANSILRNAVAEDVAAAQNADLALLNLVEEWEIAWSIAQYPLALRRAALESEPSYIADFLLDLCERFHRYHAAGKNDRDKRVLCDDLATRRARLALTAFTAQVLENGLKLLGMAAPQAM